MNLETATTATTFATGTIRGDWGHILAAADLDVRGANAELLAAHSNILGSKHRSIWGRLVTISLHLHASSDTDHGLTSSEIGDVHEGVVVRGVDVGHAENDLIRLQLLCQHMLLDLRGGFSLNFLSFCCFGHFGLI